jgi:hypothetical protein
MIVLAFVLVFAVLTGIIIVLLCREQCGHCVILEVELFLQGKVFTMGVGGAGGVISITAIRLLIPLSSYFILLKEIFPIHLQYQSVFYR